MSGGGKTYLGIFSGGVDPAVAVVRDGVVLAYSEEERHLRFKHATGIYPMRALKFCLDEAGIGLDEVAAVAMNWNLPAYRDGTMASFFEEVNRQWPVDPQTRAWQAWALGWFNPEAMERYHHRHWRKEFGDIRFPPLHAMPHHYGHAYHATVQSPFDQAVCLTIDGSGDQHTAVLWRKDGERLQPLREILIPNSLGWFYAAITEYLGFDAYDGEYKVMGLAAYGRPDVDLSEKIARVVSAAPDGVEFRVDPRFIHHGAHTWSGRFTDELVELLGTSPRRPDDELTPWHENLAFAAQSALEHAVARLVLWGVRHTGVHQLCIGGGVGLNVKMNSHLFEHPEIDDVFAQPLCSDSGAAIGAALAACFEQTGARPEPLRTLALGPEDDDAEIERLLRLARLDFERPADICEVIAEELAAGRIVGWVQGRMEAGPRALGQRSILADPRSIDNRDKVNAIIKFREYWRPFCPSMTAESATDYFDAFTDAPFMIMAFRANERLCKEAPAAVHVDGTARVQLVHANVLPHYHRLLKCFERRTGVPVLLNTSFNVKGEPIVCTVRDALRTFWSTGLEVLACGNFVVRKPGVAAASAGSHPNRS